MVKKKTVKSKPKPKSKPKKIVRAKKKKPAAKKVIKKTALPKPIGRVTHFYTEISVAIIKFNKKVPAGTALHFKGATTDFNEVVKSMQYDHKPIAIAPKGKQIGIKVKKRVREGDEVYQA